MNKTTSVLSRAALAVASLFAIAMTVVRIILMNTYDAANGFYTDDALHSVFRYTLIALAVVVFAAAYIYIKEGKIQKSTQNEKFIGAAMLLPACVFTGFVVYTFAKFVIPTMPTPATADIIMALFSAVSILYFFSHNASGKIGDARALLCTAPALVLLALVFGLYFNTNVSYVNHSVILCYAAAIFLMLATVAEANSILARPYLRRYLAYAPTAVVLSLSLSIPDIIFAIANLKAPLTDIFYDIIIFALGIYHLVNLIAIAIKKPVEEEETKDEKTARN